MDTLDAYFLASSEVERLSRRDALLSVLISESMWAHSRASGEGEKHEITYLS